MNAIQGELSQSIQVAQSDFPAARTEDREDLCLVHTSGFYTGQKLYARSVSRSSCVASGLDSTTLTNLPSCATSGTVSAEVDMM